MKARLLALVCAAIPVLAHAQTKASAVFTGTVVDSAERPIAGAEVSLPGLALSKVTDDRGAFRITGIAAGAQRVVVRHIGHGQLDTEIPFVDDQTVERRITLGRVVRVDSVVVVATANDPAIAAFEANRKRGLGKFLTRVELEKAEGRTIGSVMEQMSGMGLIRGRSGQAWIVGRRGPMSRCGLNQAAATGNQAVAMQRSIDECLRKERIFYVPEDFETQLGMKRVCYALVYLDRSAMNAGHPTTPFDVNTLNVAQIEAIEWYESAGEAPPMYPSRDANCGLAIFHSRRSYQKP